MNQLIEWIPGREWRLRNPERGVIIGLIRNMPEGLAAFTTKGGLIGHANSLEAAQVLIEQPPTAINESAPA